MKITRNRSITQRNLLWHAVLCAVTLAILCFAASLSKAQAASAKINLLLGEEMHLDTGKSFYTLVFSPPKTGYYRMDYTGSMANRIQGNQTFVGAMSPGVPLIVYCRKGEPFAFAGEFKYGQNTDPTVKIGYLPALREGASFSFQNEPCTIIDAADTGYGIGGKMASFTPQKSGLYQLRRFGFQATTNKHYGLSIQDSQRKTVSSGSFFHDEGQNMDDQIYASLSAGETYYINAPAVEQQSSIVITSQELAYGKKKAADCSNSWGEVFAYTPQASQTVEWKIQADTEGCQMAYGTDLGKVISMGGGQGNKAKSQILKASLQAGKTYYFRLWAGRAKKIQVSVGAPHAHDWGRGEVTKKPTCTAKGVRVYTCSICGDAGRSESIAKSGHSWGKWQKVAKATLKKPAKRSRTCKACGKKETQSYGAKLPATKKIIGIQKKMSLKKGKSVKLKPVLVPSNSGEKVTYKTSNSKVATVSAKGVVKGKKAGKAKITVQSGKKKCVCQVTVKNR